MPPKKKARISNTTSPAPTPSLLDKAGVTEHDDDEHPDIEDTDVVVSDPWTDDEEIGLFKGLIKWKPTGMHKHINLLSLYQYLLGHGYIHPAAPHTRIPGIWAKLHTLYDLEALDERENSASTILHPTNSDSEDASSNDGGDDSNEDGSNPDSVREIQGFELPDDEFAELIWRARFPDPEAPTPGTGRETRKRDAEARKRDKERERSSSPAEVPELLAAKDSPPVRFEPSFSIAPSEERTPIKGAAGRINRTKTAVAAKSKATKAGPKETRRRSGRVAESVATEEDEDEDDGDEDAEGDDDDDGEEAESEDGEAEASDAESGTPVPKASRGRGGGRARGSTRGRGRPRAVKRRR